MAAYFCVVGRASAQCETFIDNHYGGVGSSLNFVYSGGNSAISNGLGSGMTLWSQSCGNQIPVLQQSSSPVSGLINVNVVFLETGVPCDGRSDACGCASVSLNNGNLAGGTLQVFDDAADGTSCDDYPLSKSFGHEIGHFLGLNNVAASGICTFNIMAPTDGVAITNGQCGMLDAMWYVPNEDFCDDPNPPQGCDNGQDPPGSPVLLDLNRDGLDLTSAADGVAFDLDADGKRERVSWVAPGSRDAFVWMDRNGNGLVDDGSELFGDATVLSTGLRAKHGFEALAELDSIALGGNEDGVLDTSDLAFATLRAWVDDNHNGWSDPGEAATLVEAGVLEIGLDFIVTGRRDRNGNFLTYGSRLLLDGERGKRRSWAFDVFLVYWQPVNR